VATLHQVQRQLVMTRSSRFIECCECLVNEEDVHAVILLEL
jgi:hypothetical protein